MSSVDDPLIIIKERLENLRSIQLTVKDELDRKDIALTMDKELKIIDSQIDIEIKNRKFRRMPDTTNVSNDVKRKSSSGFFSRWNPLQSNTERKRKKVQIMNAVPTETTSKFMTILTKRTDTDCKQLGRKDVIEPQIPLIILCPNSSRLKPDVDLALDGITLPQQCIMVIIHTGEESNLPSVPSAMKLSGYEGIQFLDMGYDHHHGIYDCNHNIQAFQQLQLFIDSQQK